MGNQSDLDEAQDRLKSGTRLTRWGGRLGRQSPFGSDKVKSMGQCVPLFPIIYTHLHIIN